MAMNNIEMRREIWSALDGERGHITWLKVAEIAKNIDPKLDYFDFCNMAHDWFSSLYYADCPFTPIAFQELCKAWVSSYDPRKILMPIADGSECLLKQNPDCRFLNPEHEKAATMFMTINTLSELPVNDEYDLIIADLPLGPITSKSIGCNTVESCIPILSSTGYCVFTFPAGITSGSGRSWLKKLEEKGLYCNAILDMPINSYGHLTSVETVVAVFSKTQTEKLFIGLLSDEKIIETLVENLEKGQASKVNPKMGVYAETDVYCYADFLKQNSIKKKNATLSKGYNAPMVPIGRIGEVYAPNKDNCFEKNANSVFVPKLGNSDAVMSEDEFHIKPQNYFQIIVDDNKILPRYLSFFLNTEEGLKLRQLHYKGTTIKAFNTKIIREMQIPCPNIDIQAEYLSTIDQLEMLRVEVETLKSRMQKTPASYKNIRKEMKDINNHGDKFAQWIESLPYPIATILKRYSVTEDLARRQEMLFYFFEAYSIFESTILSAALNKDIIDCTSLNNVDPSYFEKASFGNWVRMDRALSNLYLAMLNGTDEILKKVPLNCFHTEDENLIKYLCNKTVSNVLEQASEKRNLWKGHGGITNEASYKNHVDTLDSLMRKLQENIKDLYERICLIRPISLSFNNGQFTNKVEVLTGSNPIFTKADIVSIQPLDNSKLYMQILDTGEMLELPPYFILKNSPADAKNACYFYSRVEDGNTRYVSYHFDGKPEDMESGVAAYNVIKNLFTN